jgi:hypothetical protein
MKPTNKLDELAIKYKADKFGKHNYTPYYYELFKDRQETVKKVLEMGIAEGASLFMWRDFFPNAQINGADNDLERVFNLEGKEPIRVYPCDQSKENDLVELIKITGTDIDLFIDDGSHKPEDQLFTCLFLMPILNPEVIYIIEDVADESIAQKIIEAGYEVEVIKFSKRYDDKIIVVKYA